MKKEEKKQTIYFLSSSGGKYAAFSNFHPSPFVLNGVQWPTVEHYFQAAKFADNPAYAQRICNADTPAEAKRLGQTRRFQIVAGWDRSRCDVMMRGLRAKFADETLRALLVSTGDARLVENNTHDAYWGIGDGHGANHLGRLLMKLRAELAKPNKET